MNTDLAEFSVTGEFVYGADLTCDRCSKTIFTGNTSLAELNRMALGHHRECPKVVVISGETVVA